MTDKIVVFSSCGSDEEAELLARKLLDEHLAACVNVIGGVRSFYRWKGALEASRECLLVIKTRRDLFERLRMVLEAAHSYEVPEILALPVLEGSPHYLTWLEGELSA